MRTRDSWEFIHTTVNHEWLHTNNALPKQIWKISVAASHQASDETHVNELRTYNGVERKDSDSWLKSQRTGNI